MLQLVKRDAPIPTRSSLNTVQAYGQEKSPRTISHKEPLTPVPCPCPAGPFPARNHLTGGRDEVRGLLRVAGVEPLKLLLESSSSDSLETVR